MVVKMGGGVPSWSQSSTCISGTKLGLYRVSQGNSQTSVVFFAEKFSLLIENYFKVADKNENTVF